MSRAFFCFSRARCRHACHAKRHEEERRAGQFSYRLGVGERGWRGEGGISWRLMRSTTRFQYSNTESAEIFHRKSNSCTMGINNSRRRNFFEGKKKEGEEERMKERKEGRKKEVFFSSLPFSRSEFWHKNFDRLAARSNRNEPLTVERKRRPEGTASAIRMKLSCPASDLTMSSSLSSFTR